MNNAERIQARIQRDKQRKLARRMERNKEYDNFDRVLTMQHYMEALKKCRRGVDWKGSVQQYSHNCITTIKDTIVMLQKGKLPKLANPNEITLYERGKLRVITPIIIDDRMTQRVLCDYSLAPMVQGSLIYDNGASMQGKGVTFARDRMDKQLRGAIRKWGSDFYVLAFDFKNFFGSIPHQVCLQELERIYTDKRIIDLVMGIIKSYQVIPASRIKDDKLRQKYMEGVEKNRAVGICLGSQISQIMALTVPNKLDHYVKDVRSVKYYARYMDDGVLFSDSKEYLMDIYRGMQVIAKQLGLHFNQKKTRIVKITKGFTFLKIKYRVVCGKVIKTLTRSGTARMRRKLKKFRGLVDRGRIMMDDVFASMQSWLSHTRYARSYRTKKNMINLYNNLFDGYRLTKKFSHTKGGRQYAVLQADRRNQYRWCWDFA